VKETEKTINALGNVRLAGGGQAHHDDGHVRHMGTRYPGWFSHADHPVS
jgi:hypothetical protein